MKRALKEETVPECLRGGAYRHLQGVLDEDPPWIIRKLAPLLSSRVLIDDKVVEEIRRLAKMGPIVYAMKYRSVYDLHFLRMRFSDLGLPRPAFVFGMSTLAGGSLSKIWNVWKGKLSELVQKRTRPSAVDSDALLEVLKKGGAAVLFLVDEKTSQSRYVHPESDPLRTLFDIQGQMAGSISVLPLFILYDRRPLRAVRPFWEAFLGNPDVPGAVGRIISVFRKWTVPELLAGKPVHMLGEFEEFGSEKSWEEAPFEAREQLIASINDRIRVNRGPERLSRTEIKERVLRDQRVSRAVQDMVSNENISIEKARAKAEAYVDEIAGDQRMGTLHFLYYVMKWVTSHLFDEIDVKDSQFEALKAYGAKGPLVFVPCHKSHFDYLLFGFLTFVHQMALPLIAAGRNLAFWPVGPIFRTAGVFFIRRSFKGVALYTRVFAAYLKVLLQEKFSVEFFIEGGRSRTGKLLQPKQGMLSFLVQTVAAGETDDLYFVPVFAGYDRIPEEKEYLRELAGHEKGKESFFAMLRARKMISTSYGKAYVRLGEPISLVGFCKQWGNVTPGDLSARETRRFLEALAYQIMHGIVRSGVVTPVDLAAAALVCTGRTEVGHDICLKAVEYFSALLTRQGIEFAESLKNQDTAVTAAIPSFVSRGWVSKEPSDEPSEQTFYTVNEQERVSLEFYKNSLVNYFWPASILATILIRRNTPPTEVTTDMREEFHRLKDLLSKELIVDPLKSEEQILDETFAFFKEQGWVKSDEDRTPDKADTLPLECFKGILTDLLTVYRLVLVTSESLGDEGTSQREFRKRMAQTARAMSEEENPRIPSLSAATITNALLRFRELGILHYRPSKKHVQSVTDPAQSDEWQKYISGTLR